MKESYLWLTFDEETHELVHVEESSTDDEPPFSNDTGLIQRQIRVWLNKDGTLNSEITYNG